MTKSPLPAKSGSEKRRIVSRPAVATVIKVFTYLKLVRATTYLHEHRPECRKKRLWAIEQLMLAHTGYPLANLIFRISCDLVKLFLFFALGLCCTANLLSCEGSGVRDIMPRPPN